MLKRVVGVVTVLAAVGSGAVVGAGERTVLEAILIRVNDQIVTVSEFEQRMRQDYAQLPEKPKGDDLIAFRDRILDDMVNEMILMERAIEKNVVPDEAAIDQAIAGLREENNLQDDDLFQAALQQAGLTEEALRERYRRSFMVQGAAQGETRPREITTEELKMIYERDKEKYAVPAKVELQQLVFPVAADGSDRDAVLRRAKGLIERVAGGADLKAEATLAGVEVQDLGAIPVGDLRPQLVDALDPIKEGELTQPILTAGGIQILRLVRRIPAGYRPFEEVEGEIRRQETEKSFLEQRRGFIEKLKETYLIEVHRERLPDINEAING